MKHQLALAMLFLTFCIHQSLFSADEQQSRIVERYTDEAMQFMRENQNRPFFDTSRLLPPKFYKRLLYGSGSRQGFRSTRTSRKPDETLDAFRYR